MKTTYLIDGFNLYHSLKQANRALKYQGTRWLNLRTLCESTLSLVNNKATIGDIYYFSALARHLTHTSPGVVQRHKVYMSCLEDLDVKILLSQFKAKDVCCPNCNKIFVRYEEKETDVAIATKLLELFQQDSCDAIILVTGDTDLQPTVLTAKRLFPHKKVAFAFPYGRRNKTLADIAPGSFRLKKERYFKNQFPDTVELSNGDQIDKPVGW